MRFDIRINFTALEVEYPDLFDSLDAPEKNGNQYINFPSKKNFVFPDAKRDWETTTLHRIRNILSGQLPADSSVSGEDLSATTRMSRS